MTSDDAEDDRRNSLGPKVSRDSRSNSRVQPETLSRQNSRVQAAMDALVRKRKSNVDAEVKFVDGRRE